MHASRLSSSIAIVLLTSACTAVAACGGSQSAAPDAAQPQQTATDGAEGEVAQTGADPAQTGDGQEGRRSEASPELEPLMLDLLAANACDQVAGKYLPLSARGQTEVTEGRFRIEQCKAERTDSAVRLQISGPGWRWIDREKERLGAEFEVSQYARFDADIEATGSAGLRYARPERVVTLWFEPSRASADVKPTGNLKVETEGAWSDVVGSLADLIGMEPSQQARQTLAKQGSQAFESKIEKGYTVGIDLCTTQRYTEFGKLQPGDLPDPPHPTNDQIWLANQRVQLHPNGVDLAGPFQPADGDLRVELRGGDQGKVRAQLICEQQAAQVAKAFMQGKPLPDVNAVDTAVVQPNELVHLQGDTARCPMVLMTTLTQGTDQPVTFEYMAYSKGDDRQELVPCPD